MRNKLKKIFDKIVINCKIRNANNKITYLNMDMNTGCYSYKEYIKEYKILLRYLKRLEYEKNNIYRKK